MLITKNRSLQGILDHYNPNIPNKTEKPVIGLDSAIELFEEWCNYEGIKHKRNLDGYVVDMNNNIVRPQFIINDKYFVDIIVSYNRNVHELPYTSFKCRYGKVMVIPKDAMPEFITLANAEYFFKRFAAE